jgi:hypothetical protein
MILGNSGVVMEDILSASMAILTMFVFYRWLKHLGMLEAFISGMILGLAELTKFTLLIFYPLFVAMWLLYRLPEIKTLTKNIWLQQFKQLVVMFAMSILIINMGYLFEGTGTFLVHIVFKQHC